MPRAIRKSSRLEARATAHRVHQADTSRASQRTGGPGSQRRAFGGPNSTGRRLLRGALCVSNFRIHIGRGLAGRRAGGASRGKCIQIYDTIRAAGEGDGFGFEFRLDGRRGAGWPGRFCRALCSGERGLAQAGVPMPPAFSKAFSIWIVVGRGRRFGVELDKIQGVWQK